LSRNRTPQEVGLDPALMYHASQDSSLLEFLRECDPDKQLININEHMNLLCTCRRLLLTTIH